MTTEYVDNMNTSTQGELEPPTPGVPEYLVHCMVLGDYYTGKSSLINSVFSGVEPTIAEMPDNDELNIKNIDDGYNIPYTIDAYCLRSIFVGQLLGFNNDRGYSVTYDMPDLLSRYAEVLAQYKTQQVNGVRHPRTLPKATSMYQYLFSTKLKPDQIPKVTICCNEQSGGEFHRNYKLTIDHKNLASIHDGDNGLVNGWYPHPITEENRDDVLAKIRDNESKLSKQYVAYDVFLVVYDITRRESFSVAEKLLEDIAANRYNNRKYFAFLVGNHADMHLDAKHREVTYEDGQKLASKYNCSFNETSSWDDTNIPNLKRDLFRCVHAELDQLFVSEQSIKAGAAKADEVKAQEEKVQEEKVHAEVSIARQSSLSEKRVSVVPPQAPNEAFSRPSLLKSLSQSLNLETDTSGSAVLTTNSANSPQTNPTPPAMSLMRQMSLSELSNRLSQESSPRFSDFNGVSVKQSIVETFYCNICLENVAKSTAVKASACDKGHIHCKSCIEGYLSSAIGNGDIIFCCPGRDTASNHGCMATFNDAEIGLYTSEECCKKYKRFRDVKTNTRFRECPKCKEGYVGDPEHPAITCVQCSTVYCYFHNDAHPNQGCTDYAAHLNKEHKKEEEQSEELVKLSKNCPKCHSPTVKNGGCNHMTCIVCRADWCWICNNELQDVTEHYGSGPCTGQQFVGYYDDLTLNQRVSVYCANYCRIIITWLLGIIFTFPIGVISLIDLFIIQLLPNFITNHPYVRNTISSGVGPLTLVMYVVAFTFGFLGAYLVMMLCLPVTLSLFCWYNRNGRVLNYRFMHYLLLPTQYLFSLPMNYDYFLVHKGAVPLETWMVLKKQLGIKMRSDQILLEVLQAESKSGVTVVHPNFSYYATLRELTALMKGVRILESDLLSQFNKIISTLKTENGAVSGANSV